MTLWVLPGVRKEPKLSRKQGLTVRQSLLQSRQGPRDQECRWETEALEGVGLSPVGLWVSALPQLCTVPLQCCHMSPLQNPEVVEASFPICVLTAKAGTPTWWGNCNESFRMFAAPRSTPVVPRGLELQYIRRERTCRSAGSLYLSVRLGR